MISELQKRFFKKETRIGEVATVSATSILIATAAGPITVLRSDATNYVVGDRVKLTAEGQIIGKLFAEAATEYVV